MSNYASLSTSDLMLLDGFKEAYETNNKPIIYKHLFNNGMDINNEINIVKCLHRNLQNKVVDCERYEGTGRKDRLWLQTGAASVDDHIYSTEDVSFRKEMKQMSREGFDWSDIIEHLPEKENTEEGNE